MLTVWERMEIVSSEAVFQRLVCQMLREEFPRLIWFHSTDALRDRMPGFPDLVIVGTDVLFRELKLDHTQLTPEQVTWKYCLLAANADWDIWRPSHFETHIRDDLTSVYPELY